MGFYFRVGKFFTPSRPTTFCSLKTKAIIHTPTSVCSFPREHERNFDYTYKAGPKKEVVLIGTKAFTNFLISIQGHIGTLNNTVGVLEKWVTVLTVRSEGSGPNAEQAAGKLVETQCELGKIRMAIEELKFFMKMKKQWTKLKDG